MNVNRIIFITLLLFVNFLQIGLSQTREWVYDEEFLGKNFIEKNFEGGYAGYVDFFEANLSFPQLSYKNNIEGLQLFYYDIYPQDNKIEVTFLTLLDKYIEENIQSTVRASLKNWNSTESGSFRVYQPIVYSMLPYYPNTLEGGIPSLPNDLPFKFNQMFVLIKSKRIDPEFDLEKENDKISKSDYQKNVYVRVLNQYQQMTKSKELDYSYDALNEIIRYNPLNRDFLLARIKLEQELGLNKYQVYDSRLLGDFVDKLDLSKDKFQPQVFHMNKQNQAFDSLFIDGYTGFKNFLNTNLNYPLNSTLNKTQGALIIAISGSKSNGLNFEPLTILDKDIEIDVLNTLNASIEKWKLPEEEFTIYLPIFYSLNQSYPQQLDENIEGFTYSFNLPYLNAIEMITLETTKGATEPRHIKDYIKIRNKLDANIQRNNYKKALLDLNALIRYNPFDSRLVLARIAVETELGLASFKKLDTKLLEALNQMK